MRTFFCFIAQVYFTFKSKFIFLVETVVYLKISFPFLLRTSTKYVGIYDPFILAFVCLHLWTKAMRYISCFVKILKWLVLAKTLTINYGDK